MAPPSAPPPNTSTRTAREGRALPRGERDADAALLDELVALYGQVDAAFAGHGCPASTECCRFGITGREPYVTSIELALVERAVAKLGGPRALGRSPAPLVASTPSASSGGGRGKRRLAVVEDERVCPLLNASGRCSIYASRPLGCRTYFCERAHHDAPVDRREVNAFVRAIQAIAARHAPEGDRGRPLTRAIAPLLGASAPRKKPGR